MLQTTFLHINTKNAASSKGLWQWQWTPYF